MISNNELHALINKYVGNNSYAILRILAHKREKKLKLQGYCLSDDNCYETYSIAFSEALAAYRSNTTDTLSFEATFKPYLEKVNKRLITTCHTSERSEIPLPPVSFISESSSSKYYRNLDKYINFLAIKQFLDELESTEPQSIFITRQHLAGFTFTEIRNSYYPNCKISCLRKRYQRVIDLLRAYKFDC